MCFNLISPGSLPSVSQLNPPAVGTSKRGGRKREEEEEDNDDGDDEDEEK